MLKKEREREMIDHKKEKRAFIGERDVGKESKKESEREI